VDNIKKVKEQLKASWKPILWGLIPFLIIVVIFAIPLKEVPVQVTENYWATEMKDESYTVTENYTTTEPYTTTETKTETVYDSIINSGNWSYSFDVKKPNASVSINFYGYSYPQYFVWDGDNRTILNPWRYFADTTGKATIKVTYPEEVTRSRTVTKSRDVVKARQVPTQVLKQRTTTEYVRMSIWAYLFFEQPE
jgi:hypothetical protein